MAGKSMYLPTAQTLLFLLFVSYGLSSSKISEDDDAE
jgi:hypothetical protein